MMFIAIAPAVAKLFKLPMMAKTPTNFLAGAAHDNSNFGAVDDKENFLSADDNLDFGAVDEK